MDVFIVLDLMMSLEKQKEKWIVLKIPPEAIPGKNTELFLYKFTSNCTEYQMHDQLRPGRKQI